METPSGTEKQVCDDIANRQQLGVNKYGTTVADNPLELKEWLQHAYEETLDKAVYLKRAIEELEKPSMLVIVKSVARDDKQARASCPDCQWPLSLAGEIDEKTVYRCNRCSKTDFGSVRPDEYPKPTEKD